MEASVPSTATGPVSPLRRLAPTLLAVLAVLAVLPASASAWTASSDGNTARFVAGNGEENNLRIRDQGRDTVEFEDTEERVDSVSGQCQIITIEIVRCDFNRAPAEDDRPVEVRLGDKDDLAINESEFGADVSGGEDDDSLRGGSGSDELSGDEGDDGVNAGLAPEGEFDDQILEGGDGNDFLAGDESDEELDGGEGDDRIAGQGGADEEIGGEGDDVLNDGGPGFGLVYDAGPDELSGGPGTDAVSYVTAPLDLTPVAGATVASGVRIDLALQEAVVYREVTLPNQPAAVTRIDEDVIASDIEVLGGTLGQDIISANVPAVDCAEAGCLARVLYGLAGDDQLTGADTGDLLSGAEGNDQLRGNGGGDDFAGGAGVDSVLYDDAFHTAAATAGPLRVTQGDDLPNDGKVSDSSTSGGSEGDNVRSDIEGVAGGPQGDTIIGSNASNVIDGAGGNDRIVGGLSSDLLTGGTGNDRIESSDPSPVTGSVSEDTIGCLGSDSLVIDARDKLSGTGCSRVQVTLGSGLGMIPVQVPASGVFRYSLLGPLLVAPGGARAAAFSITCQTICLGVVRLQTSATPRVTLGTASFRGDPNEVALTLIGLTSTGRRLVARPGGVDFYATVLIRRGASLSTGATVSGNLRLGTSAGR